MGLDARVRCRCWEEGKTTPCPFPGLVELDRSCDSVELKPDAAWNLEQELRFDRWRSSCCAHEDMAYARARISNWYGVRLFQQTLCDLGRDRFATLLAEIPDGNGGLTSPAAAAAALAELDAFEQIRDLGRDAILVDAENSTRLYHSIAAYDGIFFLSGRGDRLAMGVDADGFFLIGREGDERFRSRDFAQRQLGEAAFEFRDLATGRSHVCDNGVSCAGPGSARYPSHLRIDIVNRQAADFQYILVPLRQILAASVAVGNPVAWC